MAELTFEEVKKKMEKVAEDTCKQIREKYGGNVRWRWEGDSIVSSWDGVDLHVMELV